ncbi:MAG TPA: DUF6310 domain-containing protein [Myxococcaceae bacterium]|nr:DUF6310 domain-containing protein [Myxococcaceae bacterium]
MQWFVAVGACWHTPQRPRLEPAPSLDVRSRAHKQALLRADPTLKVVIMDWC